MTKSSSIFLVFLTLRYITLRCGVLRIWVEVQSGWKSGI